MKITLFTSGSTGKQKRVTHDMRDFYKAGHWLVEKWEIDNRDVILNPFPSWTVACWAFCIIPAKITHYHTYIIYLNLMNYSVFNLLHVTTYIL